MEGAECAAAAEPLAPYQPPAERQFIDLAELQQELDATKAILTAWASDTTKAAEECRRRHMQELRGLKDEMNKRDEHYRQAERAAAQTRQRVAQDTEELVAMSAEADALEAQRAALARRLAEAEAALEHDSAAADKRERLLSKRGGAQAGHLAALDRALELYRGALGLELVPAGDELRLEFTQIDGRAPERPFSFAVVAEGEEGAVEGGAAGASAAAAAAKAPVYRVTRCEPEVAELPALRAKLAATGDFAAFVKGMRRAFVAHANAAAAGGGGGGGVGAGGKKK